MRLELLANKDGNCREVVVELVWVLERAYGVSRDRIAATLQELVATQNLVIEAADDVARAALRKAARMEGAELLR